LEKVDIREKKGYTEDKLQRKKGWRGTLERRKDREDKLRREERMGRVDIREKKG
jgi:hypothetical protein